MHTVIPSITVIKLLKHLSKIPRFKFQAKNNFQDHVTEEEKEVPLIVNEGYENWKEGNHLKPIPGAIYQYIGSEHSLSSIVNSDGIHWRNRSKAAKPEQSKLVKYYKAHPDWKNIDENVVKENILKFRSMSLKTVTFKKCITYDKVKSTFTIKYSGDDKQYPWKKTVQKKHVNPNYPVTTETTESNLNEILENIALKNERNKSSKDLAKGVVLAKPCLNVNPTEKLYEIDTVSELLNFKDKELMQEKVNDASNHLIVTPKVGQCFIWDMSSLSDWSGTFHNDGYSWKAVKKMHWKNYNFHSEYFKVRQRGQVSNDFQKEMHFQEEKNRIFVHYFGNDSDNSPHIMHGNRIHGDLPYVPTSRVVKVLKIYKTNLFKVFKLAIHIFIKGCTL